MAHLVVDDEEAKRLAVAIARETGQPISAVVTDALRVRAERIPKRQGKASKEEILALVHNIAEGVKGSAFDHGEWLYDENGLSK